MKGPKVVTFRGRFLGIAVLVGVQFIIGIIHAVFGFAMLSSDFSLAAFSVTPLVYSIYTLAYGLLTLLFTYLIWMGKRLGWVGTVAVSLFVIFADVLTVLEVFNVLAIPKIAAIGEIPFSIKTAAIGMELVAQTYTGIEAVRIMSIPRKSLCM